MLLEGIDPIDLVDTEANILHYGVYDNVTQNEYKLKYTSVLHIGDIKGADGIHFIILYYSLVAKKVNTEMSSTGRFDSENVTSRNAFLHRLGNFIKMYKTNDLKFRI